MTATLNHYLLPGVPVIACEYPAHPFRLETTLAKLAVLADANVARIVDLTTHTDHLEPYHTHLPLPRGTGAPWSPVIVRFPIEHGGIPHSFDAFSRLIETLARDTTAGIPIAVHGWAGIGRTGVVVAALLVRLGWPARDALAEINRQWRRTPKVHREHLRSRTAPENGRQRAFVEAWARECGISSPLLRVRNDRGRPCQAR